MADVKWIKITTTMFEDEKIDFIESLPESDAILIIWIKLLAQAGKINSNGFIFLTEQIPYTEEMLAHKFRRSLSVVQLALQTLKRLEMIQFDDSGFLRISNWEKHQNIEGLDKIREQTRKRVAKHRENQRSLPSNVTVTQSNATEEEREEELELDIDKELLKETEKKISSSSPTTKPVDNFSKDEGISKIAILFQENGFGTINITIKEMLIQLLDDYSVEWIIEAIKVAVKSNKRTLKYVEGILQNWRRDGGMKLESTKPKTYPNNKKTRFHNLESRTAKYTPDEINKKVEEIAERKKKELRENRKREVIENQ